MGEGEGRRGGRGLHEGAHVCTLAGGEAGDALTRGSEATGDEAVAGVASVARRRVLVNGPVIVVASASPAPGVTTTRGAGKTGPVRGEIHRAQALALGRGLEVVVVGEGGGGGGAAGHRGEGGEAVRGHLVHGDRGWGV